MAQWIEGGDLIPSDQPSSLARGEATEWTEWTAQAWRVLADPTGRYTEMTPEFYRQAWAIHDPVRLGGARAVLTQLAVCGLGWPHVAVGFHRWLQQGRPTEHPVLGLIDRWWGNEVDHLVAWCAKEVGDGASDHGQCWNPDDLWEPYYPMRAVPRNLEVERSDMWREHWGKYGSLHMHAHAVMPIEVHEPAETHLSIEKASDVPRATLVLDRYQGWYSTMVHECASLPASTRSWRVDVFVKPLGWLGEYRMSRVSGRWFTGQHRWHELGLVDHAACGLNPLFA